MAQLEHKFNGLAGSSDYTMVLSGELGMPDQDRKSSPVSGKRDASSSNELRKRKLARRGLRGAPARMARLRPEKRPSTPYVQLWRVVDGAVADALKHHPEYLAPGVSIRVARNSIVKRVTGAVLGFAEESAKGLSSTSEGADIEGGVRATHFLLRAWASTGALRARLCEGIARPSLERKGRG